MTERLYLIDGNLRAEARIVEIGDDAHGRWVRLTRTIFHPQGGGQRCDEGTVDGVRTLRVVADGESIKHYLTADVELRVGDTVELRVDADVRRLHASLHTAGHLVAAVLQAIEPKASALAGHHWPGEARVEFTAAELRGVEGLQQRLQCALDEAVAAGLPVEAGHALGRREIAIGRYGSVPCGGTHLASTADLKGLVVLSVKLKGDRLRVRYDVLTD